MVTEPTTFQTNDETNMENNIHDGFDNSLNSDDIPFGGFIENQGQISSSATEYYLVAGTTCIAFSSSKIEFIDYNTATSFSMNFLNSETVTPVGQQKNSHVVNYFYGSNQIVNIPTWNEIWYYNLYPGINLKYYVTEHGLKYDFIVHPGSSPSQIQISMSNHLSLSVEPLQVSGYSKMNSNYQIFTDFGLMVYQSDGKIIPTTYCNRESAENTFGFLVSDYDSDQILVIDPLCLVFSTYLGGISHDYVRDLAIDNLGNSYMIGHTYSGDFPILEPYDGTLNGSRDIFVVKINSTGNGLIYSTFIGGSDSDYGDTVALDSAFNVYIGGYTYSIDYPLENEFASYSGSVDGIVTKLNATGNGLVFSTYLGGSSIEYLYGIAVDNQNMTYVTGHTMSSDFPLFNAYDSSRSNIDVFVTKINETGDGLIFSTFIGGYDLDHGYDIAIDSDYNVYVCGWAMSGYPIMNAYQSSFGGGNYDGFVTKLNSSGTGLLFSTYLGGNNDDHLRSIAVDNDGNVYVTGETESSNYPVLDQYQGNQLGTDVILTKLSSSGSSLEFSTYLGGDAEEVAYSLTLDSDDNAYVVGYTESSNFPVISSYDDELDGTRDAFVVCFNSSGNSLRYGTFLGGTGTEEARGVTINDDGFLYVAGFTNSDGFPLENPFQGTREGGDDAFLTKLWMDDGYRNPIVIVSDVDFQNKATEHGWSGDGTINFPYIINGITIDCEGTANKSISIQDTTAYFTITNCTFRDTTSFGIWLSNVINAFIVNNTFVTVSNGINLMSSSMYNHIMNNTLLGGTDWGIILSASSENVIEKNTIIDYGGGVTLDSSHMNIIQNNTCIDPVGSGIELVNSNNNSILRNLCTLCDRGISIAAHSSNNYAEYNHISNCGTGIRLYSDYVIGNYIASNIVNDNLYGINVRECVSNIIHNNTCNGNYWYGIELEFALYNTLSNNTCNYNEGTGIFVTRGAGSSEDGDNTLSNNTCSYNDYYGISVSISSSNTISYNTMAYNGVNGLRFASDPCHSNTVRWNTFLYNTEANVYDAITGGLYRYNYYSDYSGSDNNGDGIGDTAYEIELYYTYDSFPLMISINWPQLDTLPPFWNVLPTTDFNSYSGTILFQFDAFDVFGLDSWWLDSTLNFAIDNEGLLTNASILSDDTYPLTVYVNDTNGNIASYFFTIIVDTTFPTIDNPLDITFEVGTGPHQILWTPDDDNPDRYELYIDDILTVSNPWSGETISVDVEDFALGTHNVTIVIFDKCDRSITSTVLVHAIDSITPVVTCWYSPLNPTEDVNVTITSSIVDASDIVQVIVSYSINSPTSWINATMEYQSESWSFTLSKYPGGTIIFYKCYALDSGENWGVSTINNITIVSDLPTSTTTTPSTTTSTTTSTTDITSSTTTSTNTTLSSTEQGSLVLGLMVGSGFLVVVVIIVIVTVRKKRMM